MSIYFDFDDVISDLYPAVKDLVHFIHGWNPPDNLNLFCLDEQERYGGCIEYENIPITEKDIHVIIMMLMFGNVYTLHISEDAHYYFNSINLEDKIKIVTARTITLNAIVKDWFSINLSNYSHRLEIYHSEGSVNKSILLHKLKADYYVEDQYRVAKSIADTGIKVFLLNKSYNQGFLPHENIYRIDSLRDITKYIN